MKIAHIVSTYPPYNGGMGNVAFEMASGLSRLGHDVVVYTPHYFEDKEIRDVDDESAKKHDSRLQGEIDRVNKLKPSLSYGNAARLPQLKQELDKFDLVHLHYPFFGTANLVRKWKVKHPEKPLVVTYHMDNRALGWKGLVFRYYARFVLPKVLLAADMVHASSLDYLKASDAGVLYESTPDNFLPLPFGVDIDRFIPGDKPLKLFSRYQLDPNFPTLVFVGGMDSAHYFKGIPVLLDALILLKRQESLPQVVFVGDGGLRESFETMAKSYGLLDSVRFVGRVSDEELPDYYRMGDLFVLPSVNRAEAFGMVLLESMATGVPVIASDLPGVRTVAIDGGMVVPPNDPASLAEGIAEYLSLSSDVRSDWSFRVRKIVEEKYTWERVIRDLSSEYERLVGEN